MTQHSRHNPAHNPRHNPATWEMRLLHALSYELILLLIGAPILSAVFKLSLQHSGQVWLLMSAIAMLWNMIFNSAFEKIEQHFALQRSFWVRLCHAVGFEGGLLVFTVPIIMGQMKLTFWSALKLDIVMALVIMVYTFIFQWLYDVILACYTVHKNARR